MAQKWEYCVVGPVKYGSFTGWDGYYSSEGLFTSEGYQVKELPLSEQGERERLSAEIARLGNEGWEMAGCGTVGDESRIVHYLYFKRAVG